MTKARRLEVLRGSRTSGRAVPRPDRCTLSQVVWRIVGCACQGPSQAMASIRSRTRNQIAGRTHVHRVPPRGQIPQDTLPRSASCRGQHLRGGTAVTKRDDKQRCPLEPGSQQLNAPDDSVNGDATLVGLGNLVCTRNGILRKRHHILILVLSDLMVKLFPKR